jgi:hypothetical protein
MGLIVAGIDAFMFKIAGLSVILFGLFFHYIIYEVRNPNEYYFYYNIGLGRTALWISTLIINATIALILILI